MKDDLTLDDAVSSIMDEEMRGRLSGGDHYSASTSSTALAVENRGRSQSKHKAVVAGQSLKGRKEVQKTHRTMSAGCFTKSDTNDISVKLSRGSFKKTEKVLTWLVRSPIWTTFLCLRVSIWLRTSGSWTQALLFTVPQFRDYCSGDFGQVVVGKGQK